MSSTEEATWDTDEQVDALRKAAGEDIDPIFISDAVLCKRFLRARKGIVEDAHKMLTDHQTWRQTETPWWPSKNAPFEDIMEDINSGKAFCSGYDKKGHPISWVRVKLHDANEPRENIHHFVTFLIDETVARCDRADSPTEAKGQFSIVIDFLDFGYSNFDTETAIYILKMLSLNFPERMYKLYFVRESWLFWAFWKIVEICIDARTAKKIVFLGSSYLPALQEDMDNEVIPAFLGGASTYEYSPEHVLEPNAEGNPNVYHSIRDSPRGSLPPVSTSGFTQKGSASGAVGAGSG